MEEQNSRELLICNPNFPIKEGFTRRGKVIFEKEKTQMYEVRKPIYAYVPLIASSISNTQALETLRGKESVGDRNLILIKMTEREGTRLVHYIDYTLVKYFLENYTFPNDKLRPLLVHERCIFQS